MFFVLDLPWGVRFPNVQYWKDRKISVYKGPILPRELLPYSSEDFSYGRWQEDELNGIVLPPEKGSFKYTPHPHQIEAAKKIFKCYSTGQRGFLLADKTGTGKSLSGLAGIAAIAKQEGFGVKNKGKLLIVCPKSVIPHWRQTLHNYPVATALLRPMIINYQQLNKLLEAPSSARVSKKKYRKNKQTAAKGTPNIDWDYIIFDESHALKNYPSSSTSLAATNIAKLNNKYRKTVEPFVVFSTATPGATPLNFSVMAGLVAPLLTNDPVAKTVMPNTWGSFLEQQGFAVKKGKSGWVWAPMPWGGKNLEDPVEKRKYNAEVRKVKQIQRQDAQKIGKALMKSTAPFIMRSPKDIAGWPEQQVIPYPIELTSKQQPIYEEAWTRFRNFLRLTPANKDPKGALVENLRYRQKSSLLKVEAMVEAIAEFVEAGNQVFVSVEFMETLDKYKEALENKKIEVAEISGRNVSEREVERLKFQKGEAKVVLCTVVAGISLHSGESLPDGTKATTAPRITILSDVRPNNLDSTQALGRCHRDGENSIAYIPMLQKTIDEKVVQSFTNKTANMTSMTGSNIDDAEMLEKLFREAAAKTTPPNRLS